MNSLSVIIDWWDLFFHFLSLSLLAIGGAITTAPDMSRYLVHDRHWLTALQFTTAIVLAQASPGPNVLFIALLGWFLGTNGVPPDVVPHSVMFYAWGVGGALLCLFATLLPSSVFSYQIAQWAHDNRERRSVRAFKQGLTPVGVALLFATVWIISVHKFDWRAEGGVWILTCVAALLAWRTKIHLLWILLAGAVLGALGWV